MDEVSFNEERPQSTLGAARSSGITGFILRTGVAKNEQEAAIVLTGTIVVAFLIIGGIWLFGSDTPELPPPEVVPGTLR